MKQPKNLDERTQRFWKLLTDVQREEIRMYQQYKLKEYRDRIKQRMRVRLEVLREGNL